MRQIRRLAEYSGNTIFLNSEVTEENTQFQARLKNGKGTFKKVTFDYERYNKLQFTNRLKLISLLNEDSAFKIEFMEFLKNGGNN